MRKTTSKHTQGTKRTGSTELDHIVVKGAREHNLKNIDVDLPKKKLIVFTGVSGSGKSTLVTDILYRALARKFYGSKVLPGKHVGIDGVDHLDKVGERIYNLERAFNVREGFRRKEDTLPKRMLTEPLKKGASEGHVVGQEVILDEYYDARGWTRNGIPTSATLQSLGLGDVIKDMEPFMK